MNQKEKYMYIGEGIMMRLWKYWVVVLGVLVCVGIFSAPSRAHKTSGPVEIAATSKTRQEPARSDTPSSHASTQPANPSVNAVTQAAVNMGVLSCIARINQVATFLMADNQSGIFIFTPQNPPDQHVFSNSFELVRQDNSIMYASASFFPNQDAVYDTVEYVNMSCEELEKTVFGNIKRVGVLKNNIIILDAGAVKVFLMPAGGGTVVIKKEVL